MPHRLNESNENDQQKRFNICMNIQTANNVDVVKIHCSQHAVDKSQLQSYLQVALQERPIVVVFSLSLFELNLGSIRTDLELSEYAWLSLINEADSVVYNFPLVLMSVML